MSLWNIFGSIAFSDKGESMCKISKDCHLSSDGVIYNTCGSFTTGSDGSSFTNIGNFSSDGSTKIGNFSTGRGALFTSDKEF